jgi:O-antigen/teichoic acid export membrane protein
MRVVSFETEPRRREFGRHLFLYAASTVLAQSVSLLTTPIFSRRFGAARFGVLDVMSSAVALASVVCLIGIDVAVQRAYVARRDPARRRAVVSTALMASVAQAAVVAIVAIAAAGPIARFLFHDRVHTRLVVAAALSLPFTIVSGVFRSVMRIESKPGVFVVTTTLVAFVGGVGAVLFAVGLDAGLAGVYYGLGVGGVVGCLVGAVCTRHLLAPTFDGHVWRYLIAIGAPLVFVGSSQWALRVLDRFVLIRFVSLREIGLYAAANRLAALMSLGVSALGFAWMPFALRLREEDPAAERRLRAEVLHAVIGAAACVSVAIAMLSRELLRLVVGSGFAGAHTLVPALAVAFTLQAVSPLFSTALVAAERTRALGVIASSAAAVNLLAAVALVPAFGVAGAAWATTIGYAWLAIGFHVGVRRIDPFAVRPMRAVAIVGIELAAMLGATLPSVAPRLAIAVGFPLALMATRLFDPLAVLRARGSAA